MEDYYAIPRLSNSALSILAKSPEKFGELFIAKTGHWETTDDMVFGHAFHTAILEPNKLHERYAFCKKVDKRTTAGKAYMAEFEASSSGKNILTESDLELISQMSDALFSCKLTAEILQESMAGEIEKALFFEIGGVQFKSKLDILNASWIIDLKTCQDTSESGFRLSVVEYGYHRQAWIYSEAVRQNYDRIASMAFVCINKAAPFVPAVYMLDQEALDVGRQETLWLVREYKRRLAENDWVSDRSKRVTQDLALPRWYRQIGGGIACLAS